MGHLDRHARHAQMSQIGPKKLYIAAKIAGYLKLFR